jgi:BlaI family transcriptional regulator, penicillinase repressor
MRPTESELEILQVLWNQKEATVRQVHETLSQHKDSGYTTTLKLMQIMHEKGLVDRDKTSKVHVYTPLLSKEKTQTFLVNKLTQTLFSGSASALAISALGNNKPNLQEINEIEAFLQALKTN